MLRKGQFKATQIYNALGNEDAVDTLNILSKAYSTKNDVEIASCLTSILEAEEIDKLLTRWWKDRVLRKLYLLGLNNKEIRGSEINASELYEVCIENPYTVPSIPLEKCATIMEIVGKDVNKLQIRCGEYLRHIYDSRNKWGNSCVPSEKLTKFSDIGQHLTTMKEEYRIVADYASSYMKSVYDVECSVAKYIAERIRNQTEVPIKIEEDADYTMGVSDEQKKAVCGALANDISIITGGAGTGKTTVIGQIVHNLKLRGIPHAIVSFTGKAVHRIKQVLQRPCSEHNAIPCDVCESTAVPASTMHRMIYKAEKGQNPNPFCHLIIDECSMVTTELFSRFTNTFPGKYKITLVGDCNQLTPIGWGSLFSQLCQCKHVEKYVLNHNFRVHETEEMNYIVYNAAAILQSDGESVEFEQGHNFSMMPGDISEAVNIVDALKEMGFNSDKLKVIAPYNATVNELNRRIQKMYSSESKLFATCTIPRNDKPVEWREGDRVMMRINDYDIDVYNGEEGVVKAFAGTSKSGYPILTIDFGPSGTHNVAVVSTGDEDNEEETDDKSERGIAISHSWAITVDKSQGSEWEYIVVFVPMGSKSVFLHKNRIYTALTRAKCAAWFTGDLRSLSIGAGTEPPPRFEHLRDRIDKLLED
jgi:hypothetical protein